MSQYSEFVNGLGIFFGVGEVGLQTSAFFKKNQMMKSSPVTLL
jgi:hypothetical protein